MKLRNTIFSTTQVALFLLGIPLTVHARDIVPGLVSFDEPSGFRGFGPHHDPGDNPFELSQTIIQYQPPDTPQGFIRQFSIGIGVVGYEIGNGKRIIFHKLSIEGLKHELSHFPAFRVGRIPPVIRESFIRGTKPIFSGPQIRSPVLSLMGCSGLRLTISHSRKIAASP